MSYAFWNDFVADWCRLPGANHRAIPAIPPAIHGWSNPNSIPLLNIPGLPVPDYSFEYLPEPWWGNNGTHPLNAVVINYNPGEGGLMQRYRSHAKRLHGCRSYTDFVDHEINNIPRARILKKTSYWHNAMRKSRVFNTLERAGFALSPNNGLNNFLSIELIPWHTKDTTHIRPYILANIRRVFDHCIKFAATESLRISNLKLKNKVILRINHTEMMVLLGAMGAFTGYTPTILPGRLPNPGYTIPGPALYPAPGAGIVTGLGGYFKFNLHLIPGVDFICIWGKGNTGNAFPPNSDMDWIFDKVI